MRRIAVLPAVNAGLDVEPVDVPGLVADEDKVPAKGQVEACGLARPQLRLFLETVVEELEGSHLLLAKGPGRRDVRVTVHAGNVVPIPVSCRLRSEV